MKPMQCTVTSISCHRKDDNPIFGESTTKVSLDDEAAGLFLLVSQDGVELRFDFDEFDAVAKAVATLKQIAQGIELRDTEGIELRATEGSESRATEGIESRATEGSESRDTEGSESRDTEGNEGMN